MKRHTLFSKLILASTLVIAACSPAAVNTPDTKTKNSSITEEKEPSFSTKGYEVWLSDQTNTQGINSSSPTGSHSGHIVIYNSEDLEQSPAKNSPLVLDATRDLFPNAESKTGSHVKRLHGILPSPDHRYMSVNFVGSGHLGIVDGKTKKAVCLFRTTATSTGQQNHMTFWSPDGSHLLVSNQNGRMVERVDVTKSGSSVQGFTFNAAASLDLVGGEGRIKSQPIAVDMDENDGIQCSVSGTVMENQSTKTPSGVLKESKDLRPTNKPICPIPSSDNSHIYTTLAGGGLFVIDYTQTPMTIVADYDTSIVSSAGCGGAESGGYMHLNTGTSGPGKSEFSVYRLPLDYPTGSKFNAPNTPAPLATFRDSDNGKTAGKELAENNNRDAHGVVVTQTATPFLHQFDRVRNNVEVFEMSAPWDTMKRTGTYDLTASKACGSTLGTSVSNDPAPDLADLAPTGNKIFVALRGPKPLSVSHAAVGSCPGLGVVTLSKDGKSGELTQVLVTNSMNFDKSINLSDPHAAIVRKRMND